VIKLKLNKDSLIKKIDEQIQKRNSFINMFIVSLGGTIGLILSDLTFKKSIFAFIGSFASVLLFYMLSSIDYNIKKLIKELNQDEL